MLYTFISAHSVRGISHAKGQADVVLFGDSAKRVKVLITADAEPHLHILNRHLALLSMMMRALVGQPLAANFPETLATETAKVRDERNKKIGNDPVVVIEVQGDVDAAVPVNAREILDFVLCFDAFDKKGVRAAHAPLVASILTALRISADEPIEFQNICDGSYLHTEDGRKVHSASMETGSARAYVSKPLNDEQKALIAETIPRTIEASALERVMRLHAHSLSIDSDNYRAFLASWAAMEILVAKLFPEYHARLAEDLRGAHQSPGLRIYLNRISTVMDGKYNLADKFAVLTVYLDETHSEGEVAKFIALKKVRDQLSHGDEVDDAKLPTREVQNLFDKYIRRHIRRPA